ncbi:MAG TPA: glycosyltransferase family 1 protein [Anaerolineae bacterium]|nr:glycosyltransferase family 1 protein [Anaerolineae bacterium]
MKIALVSPYDYPYPGGVTKHISALYDCFRHLGHEVRIIAACSNEGGDVPDHVIKVSGFIAPVPFSGSVARISLAPSIYRRVKRLLRQEQFDVIHVHEPMTPALPLVVLRHCKVVPRAVIVGTFHAYRESSAGYNYGRAILQRFFKRLDGRIAVSEASRDYIAQYFPGDYVIIPNGIDVTRFSDPSLAPIERFGDGKLNILFVGRLEKRKGFRHLLAAFAQVKKAVPDVRLIVAGAYEKADREPFVLYARRHRLRDVRFIGFVPEEDLPRYYRTCDVFCAPSIGFESFGLVLLEAMAAGRPIVASDITGYRNVMRHGEEGLLVPPGNERALATALVSLLRDPALRQRMGEKGQARASAYSWDRVARRILDFYSELLEKKGRDIALC